jgi:hypothetical protein
MLVLITMNLRAVAITFCIWLALTIFFAALGFVIMDWRKWHGLAERAVETEGRVIAKEPENHRFIRYSYQVGARTYIGLGSAGRGNPTFEELNVGDRVRVFYDSDKPEESILGDAQGQASSITVGVVFLAVVAPLFAMVRLYQRGWLPISKHGRI